MAHDYAAAAAAAADDDDKILGAKKKISEGLSRQNLKISNESDWDD